MSINTNNKPCVVETPQGFSVSYNNRFLYSKYNPSKLILQTIDTITLMEGTIVLCMSPVLCYGLKELISKLPSNCFIYLCDFDDELIKITKDCEIYKSLTEKEKKLLYFPSKEELYNLPLTIFDKVKKGNYRRIKRIDFSSGTQFLAPLYDQLEQSCISSIKTFWTNRLTLTKFGRKYSYNLFKNLSEIKDSTPLCSYIKKVNKPILVFGAGESTDYIIKKYKDLIYNYFILCVDTALAPLINSGIIPDGVFVEEAQTVISKAFISNKHNVQLFCGLSSLPSLSIYFKKENISYFTTKFTDALFIENLNKASLLPPINSPFGSVGLTAVYYALQFRSSIEVPVCVTGLDFSYSIGKTHCKGSMAHIGRLLGHNKINCIDNISASFSTSSFKFLDKENHIMVTTPSLSNYCALFNNIFDKEENLYDVSNSGLKLSIPRIRLSDIKLDNTKLNNIKKEKFSDEYIKKLSNYLDTERKELIYLRSLLTGEIKLSSNKELEEKITSLVIEREYLFLHYPDGFNFNYNQSFLNRIRTEIDFFLKILAK